MTDFHDHARRIHGSLPVVDGHNDLPWAIRTRAGGSLEVANPATRLAGYHTDIDRLFAGGVGAQFWSVYVSAWSKRPFAETLQQAALVDQMVRANPDQLESATTAADIRRIRDQGRIACLLGAEGGHSIEGSLPNLRDLYEVGVRYMTLTHSKTLSWADSATDEARHGGLTDFGRSVVREMNHMGMMVDISHVSVGTMSDALDSSVVPVIASHSSCFALAPHPRNIPDEILERVADNGGVVMINFYPPFVLPELAARSMSLFEDADRLMEQLGDEAAVEEAIAARWDEVEDTGEVATIVDHIEHAARVMGTDHVGLGSDFDGIHIVPAGLEDVSCYPNITAEMLRRGWQEEDIRKVLGDNVLRVMEAVEAFSS
ncbi:MAG: dipeptidase [Acidimicrobiia bacterium]|nr:dipeptidase [Acidimicrobiia bacterium]